MSIVKNPNVLYFATLPVITAKSETDFLIHENPYGVFTQSFRKNERPSVPNPRNHEK